MEAIVKNSKSVKIISWRIGTITHDAVNDEKGHALKTAKVPMQVLATSDDEPKPTVQQNQVDYWVLMNSNWFWIWTGYPDD